MPVFLPGKSMDRGAWQTTVHRVAELDVHACLHLTAQSLDPEKSSSAVSSSSPLMPPLSRKVRTTSVYFFSYFPKASEIKFNKSDQL